MDVRRGRYHQFLDRAAPQGHRRPDVLVEGAGVLEDGLRVVGAGRQVGPHGCRAERSRGLLIPQTCRGEFSQLSNCNPYLARKDSSAVIRDLQNH